MRQFDIAEVPEFVVCEVAWAIARDKIAVTGEMAGDSGGEVRGGCVGWRESN